MRVLTYFVFILFLFSCSDKKMTNANTFWDTCDVIAHKEVQNGDTVIVCDLDQVKQKEKTIPLELIIDNLHVVKLRGESDDALIGNRSSRVCMDENYIGCYELMNSPFKLFTKDGAFLRTIGKIG